MMKRKEEKEPTLLRQIIAVHYEQAMQRKAMRQLSKLNWSVDFLAAVVQRCKDDVVLTVRSPNGATLSISKNDAANTIIDDDILMQLDDDAAVDRFIREHSRG